MKIFYTFCVVIGLGLYTTASAQIKVIGSIIPNGATDKYPTHSDIYGKGGFRGVANVTERNAITPARRSEGMLVFCVAENKFYQLKGGVADSNWTEVNLGSSGGNSLLSGTIDPDAAVGSVGDCYINSSNYTFFGPKAAGNTWPAGISMIGKSAFQIWKAQQTDQTKTEADFLASLKGEKGSFDVTAVLPIANGGTGAATVELALKNLGLKTMALQDADGVNIIGGTINGTTIGVKNPVDGAFTTLNVTSGLVVKGSVEVDGAIKATGDVTANSDIRLKKNIRVIPAVSEMLRNIQAVEFDRRDINLHQIGFIAQNIQQYFPVLVKTGNDPRHTLSVNYQAMTSPLLKGWQEHDDRIKQLENEVETLKKELEELKELIKNKK